MAAESNVIKKADMAKVRSVDFAVQFGLSIKSLVTMLGVTRMIPVTAGTALKKLTVTGTLDDSTVAEGDVIPLSNYKTTYTTVAEATLDKYRKATTAEAIIKGGFNQAVTDTNKKMIRDIQKKIRAGLVASLADGTGSASGTGLQAALADAWGQLQVAFEDDTIEAVYFVNPEDVADYLGKATITVQSSFGLNYIKDFLGLGTVILTSLVTAGTFYATAAQNLVAYYINANEAGGLGEAFNFATDAETGFVGVHEEANYQRMQSETVAVCGVTFFAEMPAGVIVGTVNQGN